jgi:hypothetical protein
MGNISRIEFGIKRTAGIWDSKFAIIIHDVRSFSLILVDIMNYDTSIFILFKHFVNILPAYPKLNSSDNVSVLKIKVKASEDAKDIPYFSRAYYDQMNSYFKSQGAPEIPEDFIKEPMIERTEAEIKLLTEKNEKYETQIKESEKQLAEVKTQTNNGVPFSEFKKTFDSKSKKLNDMNRYLKARKDILSKADKPVAAKIRPNVVTKQTIANHLEQNPELSETYTWLGMIANLQGGNGAMLALKMQETLLGKLEPGGTS